MNSTGAFICYQECWLIECWNWLTNKSINYLKNIFMFFFGLWFSTCWKFQISCWGFSVSTTFQFDLLNWIRIQIESKSTFNSSEIKSYWAFQIRLSDDLGGIQSYSILLWWNVNLFPELWKWPQYANDQLKCKWPCSH